MHKKMFGWFLALYALLRIFSYFFPPATPLYSANLINTVVSLIVLLITIYLLFKKDECGWYIVALEIILGGAGGFSAIGQLSLRTCLLIASLSIYFTQKIRNKKYEIFKKNKTTSYFLFLIIGAAGLSALRGYLQFHHDLHLVIADIIPYLFFLYYSPLCGLLKSERFKNMASNAIVAALFGNFIFILFTFAGFSSSIFVMQGGYYHWFRDVALGKITELPFHFYRIVINEHLLLVPVLLYSVSKIMLPRQGEVQSEIKGYGDTKKNRNDKLSLYLFISASLLIILSLNLTRVYLLALAVGMLILLNRTNWKRWFTVSFVSFFIFIFSFTSIHFLASRGQNLGWELFGLRIQSIVSPSLEESSLSRMLLLPKIIEKIKSAPLIGHGLGDTVTVYSPVAKQVITTSQFDWGYLEIIDELGTVGLLIWLLVIFYLLIKIYQDSSSSKQFYLASLIALLTINITSPALFHVLGIIWLTYLFAVIKPKFN